MADSRFEITPSLLVSLLLHVAVGLSLWFFWPKEALPTATFGSSVPVTIITNAPPTVAAAEKALTELDAQAPVPVPDTPTPPPTPEPTPQVKSEITSPKAKPTPTPLKAGQGAPAQSSDSFFNEVSKAFDPKHAGKPGPNQAPTSAHPHPGTDTVTSGPAFADLAGPLMRLWNPNCQVEGGAQVRLTVSARIGSDGHLVGNPKVTKGMNDDPITKAAALRAVSAVRQADPFPVPPGYVEQQANFNFDAPAVCRSRR